MGRLKKQQTTPWLVPSGIWLSSLLSLQCPAQRSCSPRNELICKRIALDGSRSARDVVSLSLIQKKRGMNGICQKYCKKKSLQIILLLKVCRGVGQSLYLPVFLMGLSGAFQIFLGYKPGFVLKVAPCPWPCWHLLAACPEGLGLSAQQFCACSVVSQFL